MKNVGESVKNVIFSKNNFERAALVLILLLYCLLGALAFDYFESEAEQKLIARRKASYESISNLITHCLPLEWQTMLDVIIKNASSGEICVPNDCATVRWDYYGSFFFASTVVSTIGFGNIAPKTGKGQQFCVLFALFGIPLCLLTLSRVGEIFSNGQQLLLTHASKNWQKGMLFLTFHICWIAALLFIPAVIYVRTECWNFHEALYFNAVTLSTIGFGDLIAQGICVKRLRNLYKVIFFLWILIGLAYIAMLFTIIQNNFGQWWRKLTEKVCSASTSRVRPDKSLQTFNTEPHIYGIPSLCKKMKRRHSVA